MREPMSATRRRSVGQRAESAVNRTDVEDLLRVCAEDVPALLEELAAVIGENNRLAGAATQIEAERNILRAELEEARAELGRRVAPVEMLALKRQRDEAQAEVKQWRATFGETALRDSLARLARTEAERDTAVATVEKALADVETVAAEVERLREQTKRVRTYAQRGCLISKSAIYRRVGQDLLRIIGTGATDA